MEINSMEETDVNEDEEEREVDLFVPGSSYINLLSLTPDPVLGGTVCSVFKVVLWICNSNDCTCVWLSCNNIMLKHRLLFFFFCQLKTSEENKTCNSV